MGAKIRKLIGKLPQKLDLELNKKQFSTSISRNVAIMEGCGDSIVSYHLLDDFRIRRFDRR